MSTHPYTQLEGVPSAPSAPSSSPLGNAAVGQPIGVPPHVAVAIPQQAYAIPPQQPLVAVVAPNSYMYAAAAAANQLLLSMPARVSAGYKFLWIMGFLILSGVFITDILLIPDQVWYYFWYSCMLFVYVIILWWKVPVRCDVTPFAVTVFTRGTAYQLSLDRVTSIEVVTNSCCWLGAACTFPRTRFTSFSNSVFFRSIDCAASFGFTPVDLNQFLLGLQRTTAANKIVYVH